MIEFEFIQSPDEDILTTFKFFQNQVYLGRDAGDLWIKDTSLLRNHLMLEVLGQDLLVHPQKDVDHYLINGKRASVVRKIRAQDLISFGSTVLKVHSFQETHIESKKEVLNRKLQKLIEENSPRISVVESLSKKMKT